MLDFQIISTSTKTAARAGRFKTARGEVLTPVFMPVGTMGTVKALSPEDLTQCGASIILANTYHLYLRPGCDVIDLFSGLHRFMSWRRPILTDSGGFQVYSLAKLSRISEECYAFQSHIDGSRHMLSPETSIDVQLRIHSDIMMCLDHCIHYPAEHPDVKNALERTTRWAVRCKRQWEKAGCPNALFGIVQGGMFEALRSESAAAVTDIGFDGYAVGGLSVGEPKTLMMSTAAHTLPLLPVDRPRYVMGVGTPEDLIALISLGADMFDCVMPTRNARNGQLFTDTGTINLANAKYRKETSAVQSGCPCYTCQHYSLAYLRHLFMARELLAYRLNTLHNLTYYLRLAKAARDAILQDRFESFKKSFFEKRENQH